MSRRSEHQGFAPLSAVRTRLIVHNLLTACTWLITMALAGWASGSVASMLGASVIPLHVTAAAAVGSAIVMLLRYRRNVVSLIAAARMTEDHYRSQERFSTAVETDPRANLVTWALHRDATRGLSTVRPGDVAPIRPVRSAVVALVLSVCLAVSVSSMELLMAGDRSPPLRVAPVEASDPADPGTLLQRLADVVREEARLKNDTYLAAIGDTLAALGLELESREFTPDDLKRFESALDHLSRALGSERTGESLARELLSDTSSLLEAGPARESASTIGDTQATDSDAHAPRSWRMTGGSSSSAPGRMKASKRRWPHSASGAPRRPG